MKLGNLNLKGVDLCVIAFPYFQLSPEIKKLNLRL